MKLEKHKMWQMQGIKSNFFFLISKNSLKSAGGRNPSTQGVYKGAPN